MKEKRALATMSCALLSLLLVSVGRVRSQQSDPAAKAGRTTAVNLVRLINTAEVEPQSQLGRYVSFAELVRSGALKRAAQHFPQLDFDRMNLQSERDVLPGWELRLVVAGDGHSYKLSLIEREGRCRLGFFSDEVGIIYHGKAIDCPVD
jgi:hypothetical protein